MIGRLLTDTRRRLLDANYYYVCVNVGLHLLIPWFMAVLYLAAVMCVVLIYRRLEDDRRTPRRRDGQERTRGGRYKGES